MNPAMIPVDVDTDLLSLETPEALHSKNESYMDEGVYFPERVSRPQRNDLEADINAGVSSAGETIQFLNVDRADYRVYILNGQVVAQDIYRAIPPLKVCSKLDDLPRSLPLLKSRISRHLDEFIKKMADKGYNA